MKKKVLLMTLMLLSAVAQGAWADTWDGQTYTKPELLYVQYQPEPGAEMIRNVIEINSAAELAYICKHFTEEEISIPWYQCNIWLKTDIDMGDAVSWNPIGNDNGTITDYTGTFYGNEKTIRINIKGATENYQGLFARIGEGGVVKDLHLTGKIQCSRSRLVGGIAGENLGTIEDCWVSADVSSDWQNSSSAYDAKVGGIVGESSGKVQNCCMSGNVTNNDASVGGIVGYNSGGAHDDVESVLFWGTRHSTHSQKTICVGSGTAAFGDNSYAELAHLLTNDIWINNYAQNVAESTVYCEAMKYPYSITISDDSKENITTNIERTRPGKTVTLTPASGTSAKHIVVRDADGNPVAEWYSPFAATLSFTMPQRDVTVTTYDNATWAGSGTSDDPYLISTAGEWDQICTLVADATQDDAVVFSGVYFKQTADFTITQGIGQGNNKAFGGIYDGDCHTLTCDISVTGEAAAPFHKIYQAVIRNLHVAGTISGGIHSAGLVAYASGTYNTDTPTNIIIGDCRVSASITCSGNDSNDAHGAGFVGHKGDSYVRMYGCLFDGNLTATSNRKGDIRLGAFIGWGNSNLFNISECVEHGTYSGAAPEQTGFCWDGNQNDFPRIEDGEERITDCIYTNVSIPACTGVTRWYHLISGTTGMTVTAEEPVSSTFALGGYSLTENGNYLFGDQLYTNSNKTVTFSIGYNHDWTMTDVKVNGAASTTTGTQDVYTHTLGTDEDEAVVTATYAPIWDGSGTAEDPWRLKNEKDFYVMEEYRVSGATYINMSGKYFKMLGGEYNLEKDVLVDSRITVSGAVNLNTAEGNTLTVPKGFELSQGNSLTLGGSGTLTVDNCDDEKSGIGAYSAGTLAINSGTINVSGGKYAAGFGGSRGNNEGGDITINGGVVNVSGGEKAAAIGGGYNNQANNLGLCGNIAINGGQVTATAGKDTPAAIGLGYQQGYASNNNSTLTLSWTNEDDFIYASYAMSNLTMEKDFWIDGTTTKATLDNISGQKIVPWPDALVLFDDQDNAETIKENKDKTCTVMLYKRKLYRDGSWNTLFLPFDLTAEQLAADDCPLKGATVKALSSSSFADGTLTLNFYDYSRIYDGTPYLVKWTEQGDPIEDPVFKNVTIENAPGQSTTDYVELKGSFSPVSLAANDRTVLYMGAENKLYYPNAAMTVGACRAYFKLKDGLTAGDLTSDEVKAIRLDFNDGEATGIQTTNFANDTNGNDSWFTIDGRQLSGQPAQPGIYIHNGQKVMMK